jgi:hypothetical protein
MPQYVVLFHRTTSTDNHRGVDSHYDWMFDAGESLLTWATDRLPEVTAMGPLAAVRLVDHRRIYLHYQGPLTDGRGEVTQVESGDFQLISASDNRFEFQVTGTRSGVIVFQRMRSAEMTVPSDSRWYWSFLPMRVEAS